MAKAGYAANRRLLDAECISHDPAAGTAALETLTNPVISTTCTRVPGMRFPDPASRRSSRPAARSRSGPPASPAATCGTSSHPSWEKIPGTCPAARSATTCAGSAPTRSSNASAQPQLPGHRDGLSTALFFTRLTRRVIIPALAGIAGAGPPPGSPLRQADRAYKAAIAGLASQASLGIQPRSSPKRHSRQAPVVTRNQVDSTGEVPAGKEIYAEQSCTENARICRVDALRFVLRSMLGVWHGRFPGRGSG